MHFYRPLFLALLFIAIASQSFATHYYGLDLFYTYVSGNTYRVTIAAYGDCSGAQFPSFAATRPRIHVRKGSTEVFSDFLDPEAPRDGIEVTPVCPADLSNTSCVKPNSTIPGVKKFVYSKEFTLTGAAPDWKFIFLGETDGTTIAGRSNSLTNVSPPGIIRLEATLDNTKDTNSSPVFTTIATPFYCIGTPVNFNPGAVDANGDSLVYELVPALDTASTVYYLPGFSGSNPLYVVPGAFSFSRSTGQLAFTAQNTQRSLVVYRVYEYRNGKLIGTCMREMTVVIMACINNPPAGYIPSATGATVVDSITVKTCKGNHELAFDINPDDADNGQIINMVANGLPGNSRLDITGNNTARPRSRFVWNMPNITEGTYTFFITYTDDGCPIASKQTQAYTIYIAPDSISAQASAAGCVTRGVLTVTAPDSWAPWGYELYQDRAHVSGRGGINTGTYTDSIAAGQYTIQAVNYFGCTAATSAEIPFICDIGDIPTAFSPNGDGQNDVLSVIAGNVQQMHLRIYNRWGELVFETRDPAIGWDGSYKGKDAPMESYAYVLSILFKTGRTLQKQGNITLIR